MEGGNGSAATRPSADRWHDCRFRSRWRSGRDGLQRQAYQRRAYQLSAAKKQPAFSNAEILSDFTELGLSTEQVAFIHWLSMTGNVSDACRMSGQGRVRMVALRRAHSVFAQAWEVALDIATDGLELEARRRAAEGDPSFLFRNGEKVQDHRSNESVVIKRYSDRLLEFLLKANRPKRFGTLTGSTPEETSSECGIADDPDPPRSDRGRRD